MTVIWEDCPNGGYLFSCVLVWLGRVWLFGSGEVELSGISLDGGLLLHPALFVLFLENLLTVFLGGILGYLFSCVLVWLGRVWLKYGNGETPESSGKKGDHLIGAFGMAYDERLGICRI